MPDLFIVTFTDLIMPSYGRCITHLTQPILGSLICVLVSSKRIPPCASHVLYVNLDLPRFLYLGKPIFLPLRLPLRDLKKSDNAFSKFDLAYESAALSQSFRYGLIFLYSVTSGVFLKTPPCVFHLWYSAL